MGENFKKIAEALFHLAQVYESCVTCEAFRNDTIYQDVLLELAERLTDKLRGALLPRP